MTEEAYVPPADGGIWELASPEEAGLDAARLGEAVALATHHEVDWPRDIGALLAAGYFEPPPDNAVLGPTAPRGGPAGMVLRGGRIVAAWGDTRRADMTFSVAKSYLSLLAGLAWGDGLIPDLDAPVGRSVRDGGFDGPHNGAITWRQMLQQTSEWEGTLFGKSDIVDRYRDVAGDGTPGHPRKGQPRPLQAPGTYWEYNDVRVNRLSLALLRRFGRALPEVFGARIAAPIGASSEWRWEGYGNSWVEEGGRRLLSVPGGGHWGGGVFMGAADQARIGLLVLRGGRWGGRQVLPTGWMEEMTRPCPLNPSYGLLWWLNRAGMWPSAPREGFAAVGAGGNFIWIDPPRDLVAVLRWLDPAAMDGFLAALTGAVRS